MIPKWFQRWALLAAVVWPVALAASYASQPPPVGWTVPCEIINVHDGDTVTVEIRKVINVRLLDCWAPELDEPGGIESREHLKNLVRDRKTVLHIPGDELLSRQITFSRVLGRVWAGSDEVSEVQVRRGHATAKKKR